VAVLIALSMFSVQLLFIILFGILPGFIASIVDHNYNRYLSKVVLAFNIAGLAPFLTKIIAEILSDHRQANQIAIDIILEPKTWLYIYSFCAIGWVVCWCFPNTSVLIRSITVRLNIYELNEELNRLTKEWGESIKRRV
jgi:hypothetical protein